MRNVTKFAIAHLEALLAKYGPLYPRRTKSSRYDEVDAREVAFKAFKVAYDRESGYIGHKVSGEEFKCECTKFDKLLLVFKDGHYKVIELPEKMFVGPDLVYASVPERERVMTLAYTNRDATYLKRFTFGGTILNKEYFCIPPKSRILFFEPDTPPELFIRYKPAPYQKINQQTCKPGDVEVKGPKTRGRQISIKEVGAICSQTPARLGPGRRNDEAGVCVGVGTAITDFRFSISCVRQATCLWPSADSSPGALAKAVPEVGRGQAEQRQSYKQRRRPACLQDGLSRRSVFLKRDRFGAVLRNEPRQFFGARPAQEIKLQKLHHSFGRPLAGEQLQQQARDERQVNLQSHALGRFGKKMALRPRCI